MQALRRLGPVDGRRVLVTGASGGVGRFAVRLAVRAGAHVVASVGNPERAAGLAELGAAEVVFGPTQLSAPVSAPVFGVLDNVGGAQLAEAFARAEDGGSVQAIGMASKQPTTFDLEALRDVPGRRRLEPCAVTAPFGADLAHLVELSATGRLAPQIGRRGTWDRAAEAADALIARRVAGKAVLDPPPRP